MDGSNAALNASFNPSSELLPSGSKLEKLHSGMAWSEGPIYFPASDTLIFSDIPNHHLLQWTPELGARVLNQHSNYTNGGTRDRLGRRISCEHLTNSVVRIEGDGSRTILASTYNGKRLNSPNDVVISSDGAVWFTDPSYGILSDREGRSRPSEQEGCFVYRIDPISGNLSVVCDSLIMPNGLAFSADEKTLYIADSSNSHFAHGHHHVFAFDVAPDCSLSNRRIFYEVKDGVPDGMRIDEHNNLWCSSGRGVEVISPNGEQIFHIPVPEVVTNLTFGGVEGNTLFITSESSLYAIQLSVKGIDSPSAQYYQENYNPMEDKHD